MCDKKGLVNVSKKQWIVYSPEVDLYYFDNFEEALKEYEDLKEHIMSEGHEPNAQVHLLETIKVATSVRDDEKMKESTPRKEGFEFDYWAKWKEEDFTEETPQKVIKTDTSSQACPVCKSDANWKYCSNCGQKLSY